MRIKLSEIPEEGRSYVWTTQTGELKNNLEDLIKGQKYQVDFYIRPINSKDFELTGKIATQTPELCSRCGFDIIVPLKSSFHEILIPPQPEDRIGKYAKVNHISESTGDGPSSTEYSENHNFDMAEYLHEVVAIALPFNPAPPKDATGSCSDCGKDIKDEPFSYTEDFDAVVKPNPFDVLKNIKLQ